MTLASFFTFLSNLQCVLRAGCPKYTTWEQLHRLWLDGGCARTSEIHPRVDFGPAPPDSPDAAQGLVVNFDPANNTEARAAYVQEDFH